MTLVPIAAFLGGAGATAVGALLNSAGKRRKVAKNCQAPCNTESSVQPGNCLEITAHQLLQLQQDRDELAQQLQQIRQHIRTESARQHRNSNVQELTEGLQQLLELTEQSHAAAERAEHIQLHSTVDDTPNTPVAAGNSNRPTAAETDITLLQEEHGQLVSWGSGMSFGRVTTSEGGAPAGLLLPVVPRDSPSIPYMPPVRGDTTPSEQSGAASAAACSTLEECWGSGVWARSGSLLGQPALPGVAGVGATGRMHSRLAISSSVGAVGLDSWGSGMSPLHQQQNAAFLPVGEHQEQQPAEAGMSAALQQQLLEAAQQAEQLKQQLLTLQEEKLQLHDQLLRQQEDQQLLQQQVDQLREFAQQQQEKLAVSEEIISRMQGLATRLGSLRLSREAVGNAV